MRSWERFEGLYGHSAGNPGATRNSLERQPTGLWLSEAVNGLHLRNPTEIRPKLHHCRETGIVTNIILR